jgi:hypothetical protein
MIHQVALSHYSSSRSRRVIFHLPKGTLEVLHAAEVEETTVL